MIFITNRYTRIYFSIIENAKLRVLPKLIYKENHHIIPRCMGGSDELTNIVPLTHREHLFCHKLLIRMTEGSVRGKLSFAVLLMARKKSNSRIYAVYKEIARTYAREYNKGKMPITNGIVTKILFKNQIMPEGFWYGWSDSYLKNRQGNNKGKTYITDGLLIRALGKNETIPDGWQKGHPRWLLEKNRGANAGEKNGMYGRQFITDGVNNSTIEDNEIIPDGWYKGKTEKKSLKKTNSKLGHKNPMFGKIPSNAKAVIVNGIEYNSMHDARQKTGLSRTAIEKIVRGKE